MPNYTNYIMLQNITHILFCFQELLFHFIKDSHPHLLSIGCGCSPLKIKFNSRNHLSILPIELQKLATSFYKSFGSHVLSIRSTPRLVDSLLFLKLIFVYVVYNRRTNTLRSKLCRKYIFL
ncbi:hypothetical protein H6P87_00346 [Rickettsia tillamookensis]|uniref:Uncharacterized protein n=1 Tax=Rickettsia tillamookensis TaxID=2761623 RepID=A0A9E6MHF2_9RICK|nr:hypothetical protein H6P87_00346 [Rickettsia tillamookensis]